MTSPRGYQTGKHLEAFILLVIAERSGHGGAVLSRLKALLPKAWIIDTGQVYRLLRQLESLGALSSEWVQGANGARLRVYRITPMGRERLGEWAEDIRLRVQSLTRFLKLWSELVAEAETGSVLDGGLSATPTLPAEDPAPPSGAPSHRNV